MKPGTKLSHFRILSKAGEGGMGVVYKAQDESLHRPVALKLLSDEVVGDTDQRKRFLVEARAASAVTHSSIAAIYEVGEDAGRIFLAMEWIEGSTLRELLGKGPLDVADAVRIATEIAHGLVSAHNGGVVHRDLKPDNIMVQPDGRVKILDFGLAKLRQKKDPPATGERRDTDTVSSPSALDTRAAALTHAGMIVGTCGYMAPEQARGQTVDARSDLFSLGVVLHEMLTGRNPFRHPTAIETLSSILKDHPPDVSVVNSRVSAPLARIIDKLLAKRPADRFASAAALLEQLPAPGDAASGRNRTSIAVLPFTNMSADPEQEYFCDGMAEELINALAKIEGLHVAARTSTFQFKGKSQDVRRIAEALGVDTVLEGSVRKAANRLRVTAQLINAADGYHLWSERYDRKMEDIFELQDEITAMIIDALRTPLGVGRADGAAEPAAPRPTQDVEAYNLYLKGRYYWYKRFEGGLQKAIDCFDQAIARDPNYAQPYAGLADVYSILGIYGFCPPKEAAAKSKQAFERALVLAPNLSEAHLARAWYLVFHEWRWNEAEVAFKQILQRDPRSVQAHCWAGLVQCYQGRHEKGLSIVRVAQRIDPLSPYAYAITGFALLAARRDEEAIRQFRQALEYDTDYLFALYLMGASLVRLGQHEEGIGVLRKSVRISQRAPYFLGFLGWALGIAGSRDEARTILTELLDRSRSEYVLPVAPAWVFGALGEMDRAFEYLHRAIEERSGFLTTQEAMPQMDALRADPRYGAVLKKLGLKD